MSEPRYLTLTKSRPVRRVDLCCRDEDYLDDVLEKQADLIRYLKEHNAHLGRKILKLTSQLQQTQLQSARGDT